MQERPSAQNSKTLLFSAHTENSKTLPFSGKKTKSQQQQAKQQILYEEYSNQIVF